ncbi:protein translocase subunit SecD [Aliiglaciecola sp. CAU 1673]|uniref:protein translocase subunit SecD n=1 Tax=Aliiglaciecola sp. CAU 1673 TaxID=3032595 RepID=UPI0023DAEA0D|nr:protein translocase subunit SecD [Aliiglaciecola sp. CAU 1673]MDF2178862.1 protein translocase subunit SecD [Aliiglaciecola sp. CAU 1673]
MKSLFSRGLVYGLVILFGLLAAMPNVLPPKAKEALPNWYVDNTLTLGLDLRGGSHLLMDVDTKALLLNENQQLTEQLRSNLREAKILYRLPTFDMDGVKIAPRKPSQLEAMKTAIKPLLKTSNGDSYKLEEQNGQLRLTLTDSHRQFLVEDALDRSLEVLRRRLDESGLVDPSITRQGEAGILVQLPGVEDPQQIRQLLGTTAKLSFQWAADADSASQTGIVQLKERSSARLYTLEQRVALDGKHLTDAQMAYSQDTRMPVVTFELDNDGARQFGDMTQKNIGRVLAVVLDGEVITAPVIRSVIGGGRGEISGSFTAIEAQELGLLLRAGALPAPLTVVEERTVGPDLGSDAIAMGVSTGLLGAALVIAFMLGAYGRWGAIACVSLAINMSLVFGLLSLLGATLTLPGIAGLILTLGMAVDANILINERIREETRKGHSAGKALKLGFDRAYSTILDSNITTLIAVSLLFMFGSGPVRGFAVTIGIGLVTSMFTAISVTRLLMDVSTRNYGRRPLPLSGFKLLDSLSSSPINVMRGRYIGLVLSALLSVASIGLFFKPGLHYGIDFQGGTLIEMQAPNTPLDILRQAFTDEGLNQVAIQETGEQGRFLARLSIAADSSMDASQQTDMLRQAVQKVAPDAQFLKAEMVGPKVSGSFSDATILAILLAGSGMLLFLWYRFEFHFALAATLTIALDLTKTIGFFVLSGVEFNLTAVAALLALIGYSINDKVVVFDRIRENLRQTPDKPLLEVLNHSITSTLTRTVFTSVTTFFALLPMGIAGGAAVESFALPMLFGIVIGTSSSVFIASPILYFLGQRRARQGKAQLRATEEEIQKQLAAMP